MYITSCDQSLRNFPIIYLYHYLRSLEAVYNSIKWIYVSYAISACCSRARNVTNVNPISQIFFLSLYVVIEGSTLLLRPEFHEWRTEEWSVSWCGTAESTSHRPKPGLATTLHGHDIQSCFHLIVSPWSSVLFHWLVSQCHATSLAASLIPKKRNNNNIE